MWASGSPFSTTRWSGMRGRSTSSPRLSTSRRPRSGGSHVAPCLSRTFGYRAIERGTPPRPALAVVVRYGGCEVAARALVDSGADISLLPLEWSPRLGLATATRNEQLIETASGAGRLVVYGVSIEVVVHGFDAIVPIAAAF